MAVLPLVHAPHPVLRQKTRQVKNIDRRVRKLVDDMIETMHDANGVGLAANQVGVSLRVAVIHLPDDDEATVLINPKVMRAEGEREIEDEGCLSIPGYRGTVNAPRRSAYALSISTARSSAFAPPTTCSLKPSNTRPTTWTAAFMSTGL